MSSTSTKEQTIEEKAKSIVNEFYQPLGYLKCNVSSDALWDYAKQRALYHVKEIINSHYEGNIKYYWQSVKQHIQNLLK